MNCIAILAQTTETTNQAAQTTQTTAPAEQAIIPINFIWEQITALNMLEALTFICFGVVCLFYGWRVFKILVILCFGLAGLFVGRIVNERLIGGNEMWLAIIAMALFAILAIPLMRWGVSALGAVAGGILAGGIWYAFQLPEQYIWAGALIGVIAGGMISFIVFKIAVMLFTSFGGSALIVIAMLAILYTYMGATEKIEDLVFNHHWFLPAALLTPTAIGVIVQSRLVKSAKNWNI